MSSQEISKIDQFLQLSDRLATAGQPTESQFRAIDHAGYQIVINLALPTSTNALVNEQEIVESLGLTYVHIPVIWENPTLANLDQFFDAMEKYKNEKVFIHCAANMRVSAFMYLYQRIKLKISESQARLNLEKIWQPNQIWQEFIHQSLTQGSIDDQSISTDGSANISTDKSIAITVKLFAAYQEAYGISELKLLVPELTNVAQVLNYVIKDHPELEIWRDRTRFGINLDFVEGEAIVQNGDEVVLIPPVSGG